MNRYRILDWDTAFFGIVTARILPDRLSTRDLGETLSRMKRDKVRLAYWASDPDDEESQRAAQSCRGFLADRKVTYVADLDRAPAPPERFDWIPEEYSGAVPDADLEELAVQAGLHSRFRIDPNMPEGKFDALYRQWIRNSVNRQFADAVLVIRRPGGIIGMVTVGEADGCGFIGLIAVDAAARGKNAGVALVRAALDWTRRKGLSSAKVVTQGTNLAACRLYEKCGYRVGKVENVYHFWL